MSWDNILHLPLCSFSLLPSSPGQSSRESHHAGRDGSELPSPVTTVKCGSQKLSLGSRFPRSCQRGPSLQILSSCLFLVTSEMSRVLPGNTLCLPQKTQAPLMWTALLSCSSLIALSVRVHALLWLKSVSPRIAGFFQVIRLKLPLLR